LQGRGRLRSIMLLLMTLIFNYSLTNLPIYQIIRRGYVASIATK